MSYGRMIKPLRELEDEIRQYVIEVRTYLAGVGYREVTVFKEGRNGLVYCGQWELCEVPARTDLGIGYSRVSQDMQSRGHSLSTQVRHELELAAERGCALRHFFIDAGVTGRDDRRPAFVKMMRRALQGDVKSVYCYDLYRFYRNVRGLVTCVADLEDQRIELISTADRNTDYSSSDGRLMLYIKGLIGERYLDDLARTTRDNKQSRAMDGYSNASWPPYGYCRGNCLDCTDPNGESYCPRFGGPDLWRERGEDPRVFLPHPIEQHALRLAAEQYATGRYSDADIANMLNGYRFEMENGQWVTFRAKGRPGLVSRDHRFYKDAIRDVLQNPYYAGFVLYRQMQQKKGQRIQTGKRRNPYRQSPESSEAREDLPREVMLFPGRHEPLLEQELFERCLEVRGAKGFLPRSITGHAVRIYPLSGLLRCDRCHGVLRGNSGHVNLRYYEDVNRVQGASDCTVRAVRAEGLEEAVFARARQLRIPEEWHAGILACVRDDETDKTHRRQQRALESQLRTLQDEKRRGELSNSDYLQASRRLERQLQRLVQVEGTNQDERLALLEDFSRLWAAAEPLEQKVLLRCIFMDVNILDGVITGYTVRDPFIPLLPEA